MNSPNATKVAIQVEAKLPRRDWVLLPLISVLTISLLLVCTELTARRRFNWEGTLRPCSVLNDPRGQHGVPNSVCYQKAAETSLVEYKFNSCGHRAGMACGARNSGSYRIVMAGSSVAMGLRVPREETLAALLPEELSRETGRKIDLYNTAFAVDNGGTPRIVALHFNDILAAKPDLILWEFTPHDVEFASLLAIDDNASTQTMSERIENSSLMTMLKHYLYENQSLYVTHYLMGVDEKHDFLMDEPSDAWNSKLRQFDGYAAEIELRAKTARIPLVAVLIPNRAQAAMISMGEWPQGYDPYKLGNELREIITSHGGIYIDILPYFRTVPDSAQYYLPLDGHPTASGHALITDMMAKKLTSGEIPALRVATETRVGME
jgi:hypothetical protein